MRYPQNHGGIAGAALAEPQETALRLFILIFARNGWVAGKVEADSPEAACAMFDGSAGEPNQLFKLSDSPADGDGYHVYDATGADLTLFEWADHDDGDYIAAIKALPKCGRYTRAVPAD